MATNPNPYQVSTYRPVTQQRTATYTPARATTQTATAAPPVATERAATTRANTTRADATTFDDIREAGYETYDPAKAEWRGYDAASATATNWNVDDNQLVRKQL